MANILTAAEAAAALRCETTDPDMLGLLPQVDAYIKNATGHDWAADQPAGTVRQEAKSAARMLLTMWHENPAMLASGMATLGFGLSAALMQLEEIALRYKTFAGRDGAGMCWMIGAWIGDQVQAVAGLVGVTGDQASKFEATISVKDQIQQVETGDLSGNWYRAEVVSPEEL